ncbi:MAG: histidine--tRNA ligase [Saprospiraceae bacterium]|nr:histidine--tRNA ligase [Saprospiraceae bacterium]MDW8483669.1 histidine--tRNA ligase [Saprospiraceae bacterium]
MQKPSIPEGTRDFGPEQSRRRSFIFDTLRDAFIRFGYEPLETPAMENLSTLLGKYGEEGDKLLFKILNNGDYLKDVDPQLLASKDSAQLIPHISKRGLRYDLTIPFARYVVMNRHALVFPFKRYQIQPVWRADRPQRGRYREFYQCDADVIGSDSLHYEAELIVLYDYAFTKLGIPVVIKVNHRQVLYGIAEAAGVADRFMDMTVAIDKLDKIGLDGVRKELADRNFSPDAIARIEQALSLNSSAELRHLLSKSSAGMDGLAELDTVSAYLEGLLLHNEVRRDITLARGLTYYTGCVFEVVAAVEGLRMGSLGGGGRYADLTGVFGLPGLSGVGISFGADRIYDVLEYMNAFPEILSKSLHVLFMALDTDSHRYAFHLMSRVRAAGIRAELYPEPGKLKKQFEYAARRRATWAAIVGEAECANHTVVLKDQRTGSQYTVTAEELPKWLAEH